MTKSRAYINEFGFERITAWAVMQERKRYGGQPLGKTYWSTHKPGQRKPVKHVQKANSAFFSYINGADELNGDGGGESLTHQLFKEAIAGLSCTRLKLGTFGEHEVSIAYGETEKEIQTADGSYYADAYWHFKSTSDLGLKWSGEVYLEVNHTHAVPSYKQESLRQARLPVVEVNIPQILEYPIAEEKSTDSLEAAHVCMIQNMMQKGFLSGRVISDRSSVEFLEQEITRLEHALHHAENSLTESKLRGDATLQQLNAFSAIEGVLKNKIDELTQQSKKDAIIFNDLVQRLATEKEKNRMLSKTLFDGNETIVAQQKKIRILNWFFVGISVLIVSCLTFWLLRLFINPKEDAVVQILASPKTEQTIPAKANDKAKKKAKQITQGQ